MACRVAFCCAVVLAAMLGSPASRVWAQEALTPEQAIEGVWIGGEYGDDDLSIRIDVEGSSGTVYRIGSEPFGSAIEGRPLSVEMGDDGLLRLVLIEHGDREELGVVFQSPDQALVLELGENDFGQIQRVVPVPESLLGDWVAVEPGRSRHITTVSIEAARITVNDGRPGEARTSLLVALASFGPVIDLAAANVFDGAQEVMHYHLQPLPDGSYIMFVTADDDFIVLHRPESPPVWLGPGVEARLAVEENICLAALNHLIGCYSAFCIERGHTPPICASLDILEDEAYSAINTCSHDDQKEAAEVLATPCDEMVAPFEEWY